MLRIGVVRIFPGPSTTAIPPRVPTAIPQSQSPLTATPHPALTPQIEPDYITSLEGLAGETTLEEAQGQVSFPILLPSFPAGIGKPDRIFLQERGRDGHTGLA